MRKASIEDKPRILEICSTIWEGHDYIPNIFDQWLTDDKGEFTLILEDDQIMGLAKFTISGPGIGWLEGLRVAPEARSRGYAKEITRYYIAKGRELGLAKLQLSSYYQNYASLHVTQSYGFQKLADFFYTEMDVNPEMVCSREVLRLTADSPDYRPVIEKALAAPEQKTQKDFLGYGWLFRQLSEEQLIKALEAGYLYYTKNGDEIESCMMVYPDRVKDWPYYVVMITGADAAILDLLKWVHRDAHAQGLKLLAAMVPEDQRLKSLYAEAGFKYWEEGRTEPNVFVLELELSGEQL